MDPNQLAAILGVLFVAASAALGFADALLCLIGAAVFYLATPITGTNSTSQSFRSDPQPRASRVSR